jgi:glutamyl/glutaminyl-tRNA synthetase
MLTSVLNKATEVLEAVEWEQGDSTRTEELSEKMIQIVTDLELKNGQVLWPLRVALSGLERSPNFATLMIYLGKEETLKRLSFALNKIK